MLEDQLFIPVIYVYIPYCSYLGTWYLYLDHSVVAVSVLFICVKDVQQLRIILQSCCLMGS